MTAAQGSVPATAVILAVGDVAPDRPDPHECFDLIRDDMRSAAFAFCQLETSLTAAGDRLPQARHAVRGRPQIAQALERCNFRVISCAGNHCLDWGPAVLAETIEHLRVAGIDVVGAGANIRIARRPVVVRAGDTRVAFLAYSSILPMAYWAEETRSGCAPMRAWTHYEQIEHDQPGTPARIHTFAHREDLQALCEDVRAARREADVVIVSLHWGIHFVPAVIADYQREVAHAAVDAGADLILGHHAHILKGIEVFRGVPIFYSLGNFATDLRMDEAHAQSRSFREIQALSPNWVPDLTGLYNFPEDSRMTVVIRIGVAGGRIVRVSVLPAFINRQAQPRIVRPHEPEFARVLQYLNEVTAAAGLDGRLVAHQGELLLAAVQAQGPE